MPLVVIHAKDGNHRRRRLRSRDCDTEAVVTTPSSAKVVRSKESGLRSVDRDDAASTTLLPSNVHLSFCATQMFMSV
ncbi:hypothetical protein TIFTF001_003068 [Ficus carica]|uniref:Uncharacterized protein n=1 Tax=Ficus carica TaxID=3494 RepID=A0AA87ZFV5_FICCA|nr:hypothetical protein TIFTF001_003068 [Ficus carica]